MKMKKIMFQTEKTVFISLLIFILSLFGTGEIQCSPTVQEEKPQHQIQKPKIYQEDYPIISDSDLYCSFFLLGEERIEAKIVSAEKKGEMRILTDSNVFYIDRGKNAGFEVDQIHLILEIGPEIRHPLTDKKLGRLGFKRSRARIIEVGDDWGRARVEKSCGQVMVGDFLIPFEEKEVLLAGPPREETPEERSLWGNIIYQEGHMTHSTRIGRDQWALIDLGRVDGLRVGDRMTVQREASKGIPTKVIGELIIINTQSKTSTVKVLSSLDAIKLGDLVQVKPKEEGKEESK